MEPRNSRAVFAGGWVLGTVVRKLDEAQEAGKEFVATSRIAGPIEEMTFLRKSLLFAELSKVSYMDRADAGRFAHSIGLPEVRFYDRDGAQAYILANETDAVVVCRGTEPDEWNDLKADLDAATALAETVGRVHRGFKREVDDLWPRLEQALANNTRKLWFAGHSLGGAMSTICAGRCNLSHIRSNPQALFTYGSPRVGDSRYVNFVKLEFYRWVNNNDIVPRMPPTFFGFRHTGQEIYLNFRGKIARLRGWNKTKDRFRGFVRGLFNWRIDQLGDHSLNEYIKHILREIAENEPGQVPKLPNGVRIDQADSISAPQRPSRTRVPK